MDNEKTPMPSLTLSPDLSESPAPKAAPAPEAPLYEEPLLTEEEKAMVENFSDQIDLKNTNQILQFGAGTQKKMAAFSEKALENVRTKDLGEVGDMLTGVITELKNFDDETDKKGFFGFLKRQNNKIETLKTRYNDAEKNISKISSSLEDQQIVLMKDTALLDQMYEQNLLYFKELTMYILAGKKRLTAERDTTLKDLLAKAERSHLPEDAQKAKDYAAACDRFEKKLHDLELTRTIALQTAPQIRLVQGNNTLMIEKIQSTLVNTIPLWKSQMVLSLGIEHSLRAAKAEREVNDMTNRLLEQNAKTLKTATIQTAKEAERGIVDIETLKKTNASLIETFDEVIKIQEDGRQRRRDAESEMAKLESDLKAKLLELSR